MKHAIPILGVLVSACTTTPTAGVPVTGSWGGTHIGLTLAPSGGKIEYDCASGTIGPIVAAPDGSFHAEGIHTPGHGGPDVVGEVPKSYPTHFTGSIHGDRMTLSGEVETGVKLGPFTLRRGAEAGIFRCL